MESHFVRKKCVHARAGLLQFSSKCRVFTYFDASIYVFVAAKHVKTRVDPASADCFFLVYCVFTCFRLFRPPKASEGPRRPQKAPEGLSRPQKAPESPRRPRKAPAGPRMPQKAREGPRRPQQVSEGPRRHQKAPEDCSRPLGSPPRAAKKGLQNAFSYFQNMLTWRLARTGF